MSSVAGRKRFLAAKIGTKDQRTSGLSQLKLQRQLRTLRSDARPNKQSATMADVILQVSINELIGTMPASSLGPSVERS